jgi:predicted nucleic-acid-binding Zn-ribbon protein
VRTGTCPKCGGRKLFHITSVEQTYCDAQGSLKTFAVTGALVPTGKQGLLGGNKTEMVVAGPYETLVCAACGFAEWYASGAALAKLARMAEAKAIGVIDGDAAPSGSGKARARRHGGGT